MNIYDIIIQKARSARQRWDMENDYSNPKTALSNVNERISGTKKLQQNIGGTNQEIKYLKGLRKSLMNVYARMEGTDKSFEEIMRDDDLRREAVQGKYDIKANKLPNMDPTKENIPDYLDRWKRMLELDKKFGPYFTGKAKKDQEEYNIEQDEKVKMEAQAREDEGIPPTEFGEELRKVKEDKLEQEIFDQLKEEEKNIQEAAKKQVDPIKNRNKLHNVYDVNKMTREEELLHRSLNKILNQDNLDKE